MKDNRVKYGVISGLAMVLLLLVAYAIRKELMLEWYVFYPIWIIPIYFMYKNAASLEATPDKVNDFKARFTQAFHTFALAALIYFAFYYLMHQLDPSLEEIQKKAFIEFLPNVVSKSELERAIQNAENASFHMGLREALFGYGRALVGGGLIGGLIAVLTRK